MPLSALSCMQSHCHMQLHAYTSMPYYMEYLLASRYRTVNVGIRGLLEYKDRSNSKILDPNFLP
eukprot:SAG11_NODE_217_length_12229_cov_9.152185_7_plen_64_part_00